MSTKLGLNPNEQKNVLLYLMIGIGLLLAYALRHLFDAFMGAIVIYILFRNLNLYLIYKRKWPRVLSVFSMLTLSFILIVGPVSTLTWMLVSKIGNVLDYEEDFVKLIDWIRNFFEKKLNRPELLLQLYAKLESYLSYLFPALIDSSLHVLLSMLVMYFVLFFMFYDSRQLEKSLIRNLPIKRKYLALFGTEAKKMTFTSVLGQGVISSIQSFLLIVGMYMFNYPDPFFWGIIGFFLSFLPALGTPLIFVPWAVAYILNGNNWQGIGLLIWGFTLVSGIDNVLRLWINKKIGNFHPLISVLGVIIGIPMFGFLGLVFGPLLFSFFIVSLKIFTETNLER